METRFAWDENKNRANQEKHKISFETAILVFEDPTAVSIQDRDTGGEQRWVTIGWVRDSILLVAHTRIFNKEEESVIRLISARKASPGERKVYAEEIQ